MKLRTRISESASFGPVRVRFSVPVLGGGKPWLTIGTRTGRRGWASVSQPIGGRRGKKR